MSPKKEAEAKKPAAPAANSNPLKAFVRRHARTVILIAIAGGAVGGAGYMVWQSVAHQVLHHDQYRLTLEHFHVTPAPDWIHADVRSEVFREGGFAQESWIHEANLAERIHKTFALHPWVAKVNSVRIRGAEIDVAVEYRKPVCMVEVVPGGVFPVDVEGVLLPRDDFSPAEARRYPRVTGIASAPAGLVGMPWGDLHVVGGAEIAAALADCWQDLMLDYIAAGTTTSPDIVFEIVVRSASPRAKDRIIWGHAPGAHDQHEPSVEQKVATLKAFLQEPAGTGGTLGPRELDLRRPGAGRTALKSDETDASIAR